MARRVDFWFDYTCPYAYLASVQVEALCARTGDRLVWRPMLLGGLFRAHGTPQKLRAHRLVHKVRKVCSTVLMCEVTLHTAVRVVRYGKGPLRHGHLHAIELRCH